MRRSQRLLICVTGQQIGGNHAIEYHRKPVLIEDVMEQKRLTAVDIRSTIFDFLDTKASDTKLGSDIPDNTLDMSVQSIHSFMENALKTAVDGLCQSGKFAQVMNSAMQRVIEVKSTYHSQYTGSTVGYTDNSSSSTDGRICGMGGLDDKKYRSKNRVSRTSICHITTAMGTLFGKVWLRTSTLKVEDCDGASKGKYEIITSFIFYPSEWLARIGLRHGVEANLRTSTSGWRFDYGLFAAAGAHPELCKFLIDAGADGTALAYEGPSGDALSLVTIFVDTAQEVPAERKI
ncbi:hypothetical protein AOQ84DRAFT_377281 [Glonium stellatum]|uniref:Uncharacterized protein n=1 Tax=Glonium stellatum TaxID=574774 RepID=A0A8E2JSI9_9PEZI|nr:hypothetical protein AOQ84DRAFT_377281 [Glonium stellatum]